MLGWMRKNSTTSVATHYFLKTPVFLFQAKWTVQKTVAARLRMTGMSEMILSLSKYRFL
jgi:hypothetical protein